MFITVITIFSVILLVSTGFIVKHYYDAAKQTELYGELVEVIEEPKDEKPIPYDEEKRFFDRLSSFISSKQ